MISLISYLIHVRIRSRAQLFYGYVYVYISFQRYILHIGCLLYVKPGSILFVAAILNSHKR